MMPPPVTFGVTERAMVPASTPDREDLDFEEDRVEQEPLSPRTIQRSNLDDLDDHQLSPHPE